MSKPACISSHTPPHRTAWLTEQVGLGLGLEGGLDDAGTAAADTASVCQSDIHSLAGSVLIYASQIRYTLTLFVCTANDVTRALRSNHDNVNVSRRNDLLEVDVEAVSESQYVARLRFGSITSL